MRRIGIVLLLTLILCGCGGTVPMVPPEVARVRQLDIPESAPSGKAGVFLASKGAYLTGLPQDGSWPENTWLKFTPGMQWPNDVERPVLMIGRIAERRPTSARIEFLALEPGIRDERLSIEKYPDDAAFVPDRLNKKLLVPDPDSASDNQTVTVTLDYPGLTGNEIYGAWDISVLPGQRLASGLTGLMRAEHADTVSGKLRLIDGHLPARPVFVLMDAPARPAFDVEIQVFNLDHTLDKAVIHEIQRWLDTGLPGMDAISVKRQTRRTTAADSERDLGATQTEKLEVRLFAEDHVFERRDQGLRVMDPSEAVFSVVVDGNEPDDARLLALSGIIQSLEMLGYSGTAIWIGEQAYRNETSILSRAAIAPALARSYHHIGRDDWAIEIALELRGYADMLEDENRAQVMAAISATAAICGRSQEFESAFIEAKKSIQQLSTPWLKVFAAASWLATDQNLAEDYALSAKHVLNQRQAWSVEDDMRACVMSPEDDTCDTGRAHAVSRFAKIWFEAQMAENRDMLSEMLDVSLRLDEIGAPWPAYQLWMRLAMLHEHADGVAEIWLNAAAYAQKSQRTREYLSMMEALHRFVETRRLDNLVNVAVFSEAMDAWRSLDMRSQMAGICVMHAQQLPPGERMDLLNYAAALYRSIGDAENVTLVYHLLSDAAENAGQLDLADQYKAMAKKW